MSIIAGWLVPPPPLIFPEVGRGKQDEIAATVAAYRRFGDEIAEAGIETVVIISPHAQMYADYFHISPGSVAHGDMRRFGVRDVDVEAVYDEEFARALGFACDSTGFPAGAQGEREKSLDHGTSIPVRFINEACGKKLQNDMAKQAESDALSPVPQYVRIGVSGLPLAAHYRLGQLIAETAGHLGRKTVVIASGDLSHKLDDEGPYGYALEGPEFDKAICEIAGSADFSRLFSMDGSFCEKAGECGHRPLVVMAGALDKKAVASELYSYEGPFGVGYGIARFSVTGDDEARDWLDKYLDKEREIAEERNRNESPHVALARQTVESYVKTGRMYKAPQPLPEALADTRAGVFVSIKKQGELRGCIGTISPVTGSVGEEIRANAVSAATRDPRFDAIGEDELPFLEYSVDVLAPAEPVESEDALDPARYGVIVSLGGKRGLLLPDLEGIDDAETQVSIAMRKAGIAEKDRTKIRLERFEVIRHR
ncbi:MAG: AmmeMemoRadiSam system protein A [Clostridiales bacterium]|nr:AmmeMemoRadiSam system protein A [Clostridiales bacterium]